MRTVRARFGGRGLEFSLPHMLTVGAGGETNTFTFVTVA